LEALVNLKESARQWVLKHLPYDRTDQKVVAVLKAKSPIELLVLYLNWRDRLIPAAPRRVSRSSVFDTNPIVHERSVAIAQIIDDIEQGRDLTRYFSRSVTIGFDLPQVQATKNLNKQRHLDLMLNDWGVHHLHISTQIDPDGFAKRGKQKQADEPLLFAVFRQQTAYLIDIMKHGDWTRDHVLEVLATEWPDEGVIYELKGVLGGARPYTDEERAKLRPAGLSAPFVHNGRVFAPAGGISTAGTSAKASIDSGRIMRTLARFEEQIRADPAPIIETIRHHGGHPTNAPEFEFCFFQHGFGVIETTSGVAVGLGP
jgi:hypothetical protein